MQQAVVMAFRYQIESSFIHLAHQAHHERNIEDSAKRRIVHVASFCRQIRRQRIGRTG